MTKGVIVLSIVMMGNAVACTTSTVCPGVGAPGVAVTVRDSLSGEPTAKGATLLTYDLESGAPLDSVTGTFDTQVLWGASDRPGRLRITIRKSGYRDWTQSNVVVQEGCPSIQTVDLTARVVRL